MMFYNLLVQWGFATHGFLKVYVFHVVVWQDAEPDDRKIGKLCEYASRNPLRIPKVFGFLFFFNVLFPICLAYTSSLSFNLLCFG